MPVSDYTPHHKYIVQTRNSAVTGCSTPFGSLENSTKLILGYITAGNDILWNSDQSVTLLVMWCQRRWAFNAINNLWWLHSADNVYGTICLKTASLNSGVRLSKVNRNTVIFRSKNLAPCGTDSRLLLSSFQLIVTLTLTSDQVIRHMVVHHSSTSIYIPNFIEIGKIFCGWTNRRDRTMGSRSQDTKLGQISKIWPDQI